MKKILKSAFIFVKKYLTIFIILFIFLFLYICDNSSFWVGNSIINNLKSIATSFTPTTDLFDDGSEVSFVSYFFGMKVTKKVEKNIFYLPTIQQNISISDEYLEYSAFGVLRSISSGVVTSVGFTQDDKKYIQIEHANGYFTEYVGIDMLGVSAGEKVGAKVPIAIISGIQNVRVFVGQDGKNVKISDIEWKN